MAKKTGDILRELRLKSGLEQQELAEKIGVNKNTIGMIERNERAGTKKNIEKLANFFGVSVDFLEGREQEPDMITELFKLFVENDIIKDINNIPPEIDTIILSTAKKQFLKFKEEEEFKAKLKDR